VKELPIGRSSFEHWLPIALHGETSCSRVDWMDFGSASPSEPFFDQTLVRLRSLEPPAGEKETSQQDLLGALRRLGPLSPAGLIFHISRCGSTLIANALRTTENVVVISEAQPLNSVLSSLDSLGAMANELLESLATVYGHDASGGVQRLIFKFTSWNIVSISVIRAVWPSVPCIIVIRDPIEVIVSNLATPSGWMRTKAIPSQASTFDWAASDVDMAPEEYCARVLGLFCKAAHEALDGNCRVVNYEDLNISTLQELGKFVGLPPLDTKAVEQILDLYSKDPTRRYHFSLQREHRQRERLLTDSVKRAADQWSYPFCSRLREFARG
jgi:hypothetical protein